MSRFYLSGCTPLFPATQSHSLDVVNLWTVSAILLRALCEESVTDFKVVRDYRVSSPCQDQWDQTSCEGNFMWQPAHFCTLFVPQILLPLASVRKKAKLTKCFCFVHLISHFHTGSEALKCSRHVLEGMGLTSWGDYIANNLHYPMASAVRPCVNIGRHPQECHQYCICILIFEHKNKCH